MSLVLIQAQLLRKIIVSTGVAAQRILGLQDPQPCPAWLAKPEDARSLAEQIQQAIAAWRYPSDQLTQQLDFAANRAQSKFNISNTVKQLVQHVESVRAQ